MHRALTSVWVVRFNHPLPNELAFDVSIGTGRALSDLIVTKPFEERVPTHLVNYIWKTPLSGWQSGLNPEGSERAGVQLLSLPPILESHCH